MRFTKLIVLLVVSLLIFNTTSLSLVSNAAPKIVIGDLDNDNLFNSDDYSLMRRYLLEMIDEKMLSDAGDVDGNGMFDSDDYSLMRRHLLGMIDKFPRELSIETFVTPTPTTKITPIKTNNEYIRLDLDKKTSFVGDIVTATISIKNIKKFAAFQTTIKYDPLVLSPIDSNGNAYDKNTCPQTGDLLTNKKYNPVSMSSHVLSNGILNFGRAYLDLEKYKATAKPYEKTGSIAIIKFKVLSAKKTTVSFVEDEELIPQSNNGTLLFDTDGYQITKYSVIQANPLSIDLPGDIDNNGTVDNYDISYLNKLLQNLLPQINYPNSVDVNGDGKFSIDDLILLQKIVNETFPSSEPTPTPTSTPTPTINQTATPTYGSPIINGNVSLSVDKKSASVGEIVQASIDYSNVYGFSGFQAHVVYDPMYLQPVYLDGETYKPYDKTTKPEFCCLHNDKYIPFSLVDNDILKGSLNFGKAYQLMESYKNSGVSESNGVLARISFRVIKSGMTSIEIKNCPSMPSASNGILMFDWNSTQLTNFTIDNSFCKLQLTQSIPNVSPTPVTYNQKLLLITDKSYVNPGDIVTSKISISQINNFAGYQASLKYDPTILKPVILDNGEYIPYESDTCPLALGLNNKKYVPVDISYNNLSDGILNFGRAYMNLEVYKASGIPESTQDLCVISFKAIKSGSVHVYFQETSQLRDPDGVIVYNWDGEEIQDITIENKYSINTVTATPTIAVTPTPTKNDTLENTLSINVPDLSYKVGDIIKASIDVNLKSISGYQVNLKYDPSVLEPLYFDGSTYVPYEESTMPNSGTLFMQSKYLTNSNAANDLNNGYLNFSNSYLNLPLYQKSTTYDKAGSVAVIYFKVLKDSATELYFEDCLSLPGAYKGTMMFDKDANRITNYYIDTASINTSKTAKLSLSVDKTHAKVGEYILATLSIKDMQNFQGYQASLKYDPKVLQPVLSTDVSFEPYLPITMPEPGNLLQKNLLTFEAADNKLDEGILTFGKAYLDITKLTSSGLQEPSGTLANIYFKVLQETSTQINIINYDNNSVGDATILLDYTKENFKDFEVSPSNVAINATSSKNGCLYLSSDKKYANEGNIIKYTLGVENINLTGYQVSLKYDPTALMPVLEDGTSYDISTTPNIGVLLANKKFIPFEQANNDLQNGILTFGRCYLDIARYRSSGIQETSGSIAVLYFKVLKNTSPVVNFTRPNLWETLNNSTSLFDLNGDPIKDYDIRN